MDATFLEGSAQTRCRTVYTQQWHTTQTEMYAIADSQ